MPASREGLGQHARRDLPGNAPFVFAPAARALLAAIADDGVPVAVSLLLIVGGDLEGEGFVMLERGTAVEPDTGDARDREFDRQHVARLAGRVVTGCAVDGADRAVGKRLGVESGSGLGVLVIPQANRVLRHRFSFRNRKVNLTSSVAMAPRGAPRLPASRSAAATARPSRPAPSAPRRARAAARSIPRTCRSPPPGRRPSRIDRAPSST